MKTVFVVAHVLAACFGVGGALMMDAYLLRHLRGETIEARHRAAIDYMALFVKGGLVGIWASGIAVIAAHPDGAAAVLANPKVQAKLVIVVVLTLNALFIETMALPLIHRNEGRRLFDGVGEVHRTLLVACGAISATSWCAPLALGLARELNHVVPAGWILAAYACVLLAAGFAAQVGVRLVYRDRKRPALAVAAAEPERRADPDAVPTAQAAARARIEAAFAPGAAGLPDRPDHLRDAEAVLQRIERRLASRRDERQRAAVG